MTLLSFLVEALCVTECTCIGGCHGDTSSAGRVAISRSGTESPWRSGSNTAWDSMFLSTSDHRFSPGGMKGDGLLQMDCPY